MLGNLSNFPMISQLGKDRIIPWTRLPLPEATSLHYERTECQLHSSMGIIWLLMGRQQSDFSNLEFLSGEGFGLDDSESPSCLVTWILWSRKDLGRPNPDLIYSTVLQIRPMLRLGAIDSHQALCCSKELKNAVAASREGLAGASLRTGGGGGPLIWKEWWRNPRGVNPLDIPCT